MRKIISLCCALIASASGSHNENSRTRLHVLACVSGNKEIQEIIKQYLNSYDRLYNTGPAESYNAQLISSAPNGCSFIFAKVKQMSRTKFDTSLHNVSLKTGQVDEFAGALTGSKITALGYTPDGAYLAIAQDMQDVQIRRITPESLDYIYSFTQESLLGSVCSLAYAPHANDLAIGLVSPAGSVVIYDTLAGICKNTDAVTRKIRLFSCLFPRWRLFCL